MNPPTHCLECNAPLTAAETQGLCARCLLKLGFASQLAGASSLPASPGNSGPPPMMPFTFGPYRIERLLGKGGMGAVYEAEDTTNGRRVALKALGHSLDSPDTRKRFLREGRIAASINHPNSVYVYGTEEIDGAPVITMELIPGGTLQERVKEDGPMAVSAAVDAILQIIAGLEAAYAVGILHRDIKPSNCFIDLSGGVKVGDFGLSISTTSRGDSALTIAGSVLGTPEFSSPEQLRGEALDLRADIYSVGMTLYYLLTAQTPFRAANVVQLLATVLEKPAPSPRTVRPEIPEELARIVLRCLAKPAGDRFKNYDELRRALLPFQSTSPTPATLARRFLAGVIDEIVLGAVSVSISSLFLGEFLDKPIRGPHQIWISLGMAFFGLAYFAAPEGLWGASLGKALLGLRVGGPDRNAPGLARAAWRVAIYMLPTLLMALSQIWRDVESDLAALSPLWKAVVFTAISAYHPLLALTARRRNGFATIVDLLTKTRVNQRSAYEPRESVAQVEGPVSADDTAPEIGPFHALATLATDAGGELVLGYDTKLLRRVWIRKAPAGAPAVAAALRNAARSSRLRWLQGHRDDSGSWDAYEAAPGAPLVSLLHRPQPWRHVRHWLLDLATELDIVSRGGAASGPFSLDRVWITADGRAKLLDFPAPGADQGAEEVAEAPVFLNQLAVSALEGRLAPAEEARFRQTRAPVPIPAREVLRDLRLAPDFAALALRLRPLVNLIPEVSRRRRFGLLIGCVAPALMLGALSFVGMRMIRGVQRQYPDAIPLMEALMIRDRISQGKFPHGIDPKIGVEPMEIYIAGRFGDFIRDPNARSSRVVRGIIPPGLRVEAERIVAAHPNPTPAEMENARAALGRVINSKGNLSGAPGAQFKDSVPWEVYPIAIAEVFVCAACFSLLAALVSRGGLLLRALGIAVVRRDGADAARVRMLWRACIAWSWLPLGIVAFLKLKPLTGWPAALAIVGLIVLGAVVWSAVRPGQSLQDRLAGTWLVPR